MEVEDRGGDGAARAHAVLRQLGLHGAEGIVERVHEEPPHRVHHQHPAAAGQPRPAGAAARRAGREVDAGGSAGASRLDVGDDLLAVPGVVAERDHVGAGGEEGARHVGRQAEAVRGVLAIHHDAGRGEVAPQAGQLRRSPRRGRCGRRRRRGRGCLTRGQPSGREDRSAPPRWRCSGRRDVLGPGGHFRQLLRGIGDAERASRRAARPGCGRSSRRHSRAAAPPVEGEQRHQQPGRAASSGARAGLAGADRAGGRAASPGRQRRNCSGWPRLGVTGSASAWPRACSACSSGRMSISRAHRPEAGDDGARGGQRRPSQHHGGRAARRRRCGRPRRAAPARPAGASALSSASSTGHQSVTVSLLPGLSVSRERSSAEPPWPLA